MALFSVSRVLSSSIRLRNHKLSFHFTSDTSVDKVYGLLQKNGGNVEKSLASVSALLGPRCVRKVLERCYPGQSQMGLRFFIWAAFQSEYRHSNCMYTDASTLFRINQHPQVLFDVIDAYKAESCLVSLKTFKVILKLYQEANLADEALRVLKRMPEFGLRPDTTMFNVVIRLFCQKGDMDMAEGLMKEMGLMDLHLDMITCMEMIKGFCNACRLEDAYGILNVLKGHGCFPNTVLYSLLLDGVCRHGNMEKALELLAEMENGDGNGLFSCSPNVVTYTSVIQRFCERGWVSESLKVLDRMEAFGCSPNRVTASFLIECFCAEGRMEEVYKLIDRVVRGGDVSYGECYSSLVVSLEKNKKHHEAEKVFRKMLDSGMRPDGLACSIMIRELCLEGRLLDGYHLCDEIESSGCLSSIDSDIYSIILVGLCEQKHSLEALKLARLMLKKGIRPKAPYIDSIIKNMKNYGNEELVNHFTMKITYKIVQCEHKDNRSTRESKDLEIPWLENKVLEPKPGAEEANCQSVADLLIPNTRQWNEELLDELFTPASVQAIKRIGWSTLLSHDKLIWKANNTGIFSVQMAYIVLKGFAEYEEVDPIWKQLWKPKLHIRLKVFMRRILSGSLPARECLADRLGLNEKDFTVLNPRDMLRDRSLENEKASLILASAMYSAWHFRNKNLLEGKKDIKATISFPPDEDWLVANTDVAINSTGTTFALVFRDCRGKLVFKASKLMTKLTASFAELKAIDWASDLALERGWRNLKWKYNCVADKVAKYSLHHAVSFVDFDVSSVIPSFIEFQLQTDVLARGFSL
ncbi:hypothetical protein FNV43_RR12608 [Rhamnella rubrinervis]|uniref:Pentatricopeptide repeat-containing protein n=1 Tax=Rhamnella rubrinervis TaxID=2594499 RepID=A0A8K0H7M5_9ROSA|nr:hypothetical protein FNV43_RR12608 [Rhamnella rubrinervis]